jgi:hypothetical protein
VQHDADAQQSLHILRILQRRGKLGLAGRDLGHADIRGGLLAEYLLIGKKPQPAPSKLDRIPVRQCALGYPRVVYQRAVEAAQIANEKIVPLPDDDAVLARNRRVGE